MFLVTDAFDFVDMFLICALSLSFFLPLSVRQVRPKAGQSFLETFECKWQLFFDRITLALTEK